MSGCVCACVYSQSSVSCTHLDFVELLRFTSCWLNTFPQFPFCHDQDYHSCVLSRAFKGGVDMVGNVSNQKYLTPSIQAFLQSHWPGAHECATSDCRQPCMLNMSSYTDQQSTDAYSGKRIIPDLKKNPKKQNSVKHLHGRRSCT